MPIDPSIIGSAISGGVSLLGGLFGGHSNKTVQDRANETNLQIAREANQNQYQMFQEQNAFNERMWNQMNQYNSPASQMQRYTDAGINPYIAAGNVQTGNAQSTLQSAPAPQQHVAQVMPATGMGDAVQNSFAQIGNVISQFAQNQLALAQAKKTDAEASWIDRLNSAQMGKLGAETLNLHNQNSLLGLDYQIKSDTLGNYKLLSDLSVQQAALTNNLVDAQTRKALFESDLAMVESHIKAKYGEKQVLQEISESVSRQYLNYVSAHNSERLTTAQCNLMFEQAKTEVEKRFGILLDNDTSRRISNFVVDSYHSNAKIDANQARISFFDALKAGKDDKHYNANNWIRWISSFVPFASGLGSSSISTFGRSTPVKGIR